MLSRIYHQFITADEPTWARSTVMMLSSFGIMNSPADGSPMFNPKAPGDVWRQPLMQRPRGPSLCTAAHVVSCDTRWRWLILQFSSAANGALYLESITVKMGNITSSLLRCPAHCTPAVEVSISSKNLIVSVLFVKDILILKCSSRLLARLLSGLIHHALMSLLSF